MATRNAGADNTTTRQRETLASGRKWYLPMTDDKEHALARQLAERGLDTRVPNVARIYDYFLSGKNNFKADRDAAERIADQMPATAAICLANREFLGRVVRLMARDAGIRQFLDVGSGLPTRDSVHEIAQRAAPEARVVYVDNDPVAVNHSQAILATGSSGVIAVEADLRDPASITDHPRVRELLDFGQPAAVLLFAVLHFVTDDEAPYEMVRSLADAMAPGSFLAISHATDEGVPRRASLAAQEIYRGASAPVVPRSRDGIARFFDGLEVLAPGVVNIDSWPGKSPGRAARIPLALYGGVARKPAGPA